MINVQQIILNSPLFRFLSQKSKKIILPGFERVPLYDVIKFFLNQIRKVGLNDRARSIAFSFLTAIPAAAIFICTLIPYLPVSKKITHQLMQLTKDITPNQNTAAVVSNFLNDFLEKPRSGLLSFGLLVALFYASNAMMGLMRSFNKSLIYNSKRNFLQTRWMAIKLTLLLVLLVIGSFAMLITQDQLLRNLLKWMNVHNRVATKTLLKTLRWIVIIPLFYFCIAFIYKYAPAVNKRWKLSSPGTLLATFLFILTTFVFSYWVNKFGAYNKVYGSIGSILILMLLIYFDSMILLIGYELNVSIHHLKVMADERAEKELKG
ncbi:MAG: YihY/virulence factor BrkB family protein [Bacteroidetes bacterium]|nr:YihY/virulence factor BrkB family protein [Bacteroidota bacterium]